MGFQCGRFVYRRRGFLRLNNGTVPLLYQRDAATLIVTNTNDSGIGSLRQAIADAVPGSTITFDPSLAGQTIPLTSQINIDKNLTIDGSGLNASVEISGSLGTRIFYISPNATVTLQSLVLKNGRCNGSCDLGGYSGGGIYIDKGTLTVTNSTISGNSADQGGGIYMNNGTLSVTNSIISGNSAPFGGGGIFNINNSDLTITNSTFSGNSAA